MAKRIVIALGGNAILQRGQKGTAEEQMANVRVTAEAIAELVARGYEVVITHGNGPQVGNILIQNEEAKGRVPKLPLDFCGAESQGLIGYMIQQNVLNVLSGRGIKRPVVTLLTQVEVRADDPAFGKPTKPIGPFLSKEEAERNMKEKGETWVEDAGRGWRKVVPSPDPKAIVEAESINALVEAGHVVIASGGGGVPVVREKDGTLRGVEAVIDKDLAGAELAKEVKADILMILTDVERVALNYGKPDQRGLDVLTVDEARAYGAEGHFKAGSMGPKVEAAVRFVEAGGEAVIGSLMRLLDCLEGRSGTRVVKSR